MRTPSLAARVVLSRQRLLNHPGHDQRSHGRKGSGRPKTGQDALDAAPSGMDPRRGLSASQAESIQEYRGLFGYRRINGQLREGQPDAKTVHDVEQMDAAMRSSPLSADVTVYRGIGDGEVLFGGGFDGDMTGVEWSDRAFTSTTASELSATSYSRHGLGRTGSGPVVMSIRAPRGTGAVQLSQMDEDGRGSELLLDRGLGFRVTADHGVRDGVRMLDVEVIR